MKTRGTKRGPVGSSISLVLSMIIITLFVLCHKTELSKRPFEGWLGYMGRRGLHNKLKLHISSLTPSFRHHNIPRGCALSWSMLYMAQFAPDQAAELYGLYREQFFTHVAGLGGFREYPPGVDVGADVDSGPIILGMGMAATGLGLGPSRLFGDRRTYISIMRTASSVGFPVVLSPRRRYLFSPWLGEAILFHATTARRWDGQERRDQGELCDEPPFPTIPLVICLLQLMILALLTRRALRKVARLRAKAP